MREAGGCDERWRAGGARAEHSGSEEVERLLDGERDVRRWRYPQACDEVVENVVGEDGWVEAVPGKRVRAVLVREKVRAEGESRRGESAGATAYWRQS